MDSDGGPQQRTSATFQINQTEFKKSFLRPQAQSIVILSSVNQPYGMTVVVILFLTGLSLNNS
jgi:hypothetical protein